MSKEEKSDVHAGDEADSNILRKEKRERGGEQRMEGERRWRERGGEQRMEGERGGEGACVNLGHLLCISVAICLTASEAGPPSPSAGLLT